MPLGHSEQVIVSSLQQAGLRDVATDVANAFLRGTELQPSSLVEVVRHTFRFGKEEEPQPDWAKERHETR